MASTRIAILGTGSAGIRHLRVMAELPGVEVVAIPCRPERRAELASQGFAVAGDLSEVFPCDGVVIATDSARHARDLRRVLDLNVRAVLLEKPLAPSWGALEEQGLVRRLGSPDSGIFVGCCLRFNPGLLSFREQLPEIRPVHATAIECRSYLPDWRPQRDYRQSYSARRSEGGVLNDLIHEVDYAAWLFGAPDRVFGRLGYSGRLEIESEDQAELFWTAPSGAYVTIGLDYLSRTPVRRMTAYGAGGTLTWDALAQAVRFQRVGRPAEIVEAVGTQDDVFRAQAKAFLAAIAGDGVDLLATGREGGQAVAICDAVRRSSESGCLEAVAYGGLR